jgi:hypothetical protein
VFESLSHLNAVISHVFASLATRVTAQHSAVNDIQRRVRVASDKVAIVAARPVMATVLRSPAKYPAPASLPHYQNVLLAHHLPLPPIQATIYHVNLIPA